MFDDWSLFFTFWWGKKNVLTNLKIRKKLVEQSDDKKGIEMNSTLSCSNIILFYSIKFDGGNEWLRFFYE